MEVDSKSPADAGSHAGSKSRAVVNHREMLALPALKILADPDHSEKSLLVLMSVMDRCCEPGNQAVFIGARDREEDQSVGLAFTKWFLGRFSVIFTRKQLFKVHQSFVELHVKILNLFKVKEPQYFTALIGEYAKLLEELVLVSEQRCSGVLERSHQLKLSVFPLSDNIQLSHNCTLSSDGLLLSSILECTLLQSNVTQIIALSARGNRHYQVILNERLSYTMLKQLDNGGVDLFEVTLECLPLILPDDCSAKILEDILHSAYAICGLLNNPTLLMVCVKDAVLDIAPNVWQNVELVLVQCLTALSPVYTKCVARNRQFFKLIQHVVKQIDFTQASATTDGLLTTMLSSLNKYPSAGNIELCRFDLKTWIQLIHHSKVAVDILGIIVRNECLVGVNSDCEDYLEDCESSAKKSRVDFNTVAAVPFWTELKNYWRHIQEEPEMDEESTARILVRIASVAMKLKTKNRDLYIPFDDKDCLQLNTYLRRFLGETVTSDTVIDIVCEYLNSCVPMAHHTSVDKNIVTDWLILSSLPWLQSMLETAEVDRRWHSVCANFQPELLQSRATDFADSFVKFPASFYKQWAIDVGMTIIRCDSFLEKSTESLIKYLPWIVRHGRVYRDLLSQRLTTIMASASPEIISQLTANASQIMCSLSGKTTVHFQTDTDTLILRCPHSEPTESNNTPNSATQLKLSNATEDIALLMLELVFDESDLVAAWPRYALLSSILNHLVYSDTLHSCVRKKLMSVTSKCSGVNNQTTLQRVLLKCCTLLVQFWAEKVVADCLHVVLHLILPSYSPLMSCWASNAVRDMANRLNFTAEVLFSRYIGVICDVLLSKRDLEWRVTFLAVAPEVFSLVNIAQWQMVILPNLLPKLIIEVCCTGGESETFFHELCTALNKRPAEIFGKYFSCIYTHLLLSDVTSEDHERVVAYMEDVCQLGVVQLRAPNFQSVHNDLLMQLHSCKQKVLDAIGRFLVEDKTCPKNRRGAVDRISDYLRPRFLGFLVHLDSRIVSKSVADSVKIEALSSLKDLLELMGADNVTAVRLKILATLRAALSLTEEPFPQLNAAVWDAFVRSINIAELAPLIGQIVVSILHLYERCSETIRSILYFIVVENAERLKDHLKDLHFLPQLTGLEDIVYSWKKACLSSDSVTEQLSLMMVNLGHEDLTVRREGLAHLKRIAQHHPDQMQKLILGSSDPALMTDNNIVIKLISSLIKGCSVQDEQLLQIYSECFGLVGAIDPGLLNLNDEHSRDPTIYTATLIDDEFVFSLLNLLARSFLAPKNAQTLDCCSFSIQEILKTYRTHGEPSKMMNTSLWARFPPHIRVAFTPLLSSRYILKQQNDSQEIPFPIYRSCLGKTYASWIFNWIVALVKRVDNTRVKEIFQACQPFLRRDMHVCLFLLPYVAISALWSASGDDRDRVQEEMLAVLTDRGIQKSPRRTLKRFSSHTTEDSSSQVTEKDSADCDLHQLSMQAVFYLLDHMKKWLKQKLSTSRSKKERSTVTLDQDYKVVKQLVDSIPDDLLARASYQCQAYARAVLHLEAHLKANPSQLREQLGFLQKLYVSLDDPDGVAGVCAIRDHEPSLEEQITAYGATGRLQDAFSCYERISQREDCSLEFYQGMLRCLLNLDLPQGALTMANGLLQDCPEWRNNLDDYRAECCWRLGQWEILEQVVKSSDHCAANVGWGVGLGQALLAAKRCDFSDMERSLRSVRLGQMRAISAVNLERNSYPRAYENLVNLHVLSELESAVSLVHCTDQTFDVKFRQLLDNWDARFECVQASVRFMEPILNMRRVALKLIEPLLEAKVVNVVDTIEKEIGKSWLVSARLARKANHFQRAHILQLVASTSPVPPAAIYMEQAKLHWAKGEHDQAITLLKRGIDKRFPDMVSFKKQNCNVDPSQLAGDAFECLKAKLLLAKYYDQTGNTDMASIIAYYKEVIEVNKHWEDGLFFLAQYYDRLWIGLDDKELHGDVVRYIIINLGRSMQFGSQYIYQAMPRMLSLWMELGTLETENSCKGKNRIRLSEINKMIAGYVDTIPSYKFLTAYPQLISRICHPHPEIVSMLRSIIAKLLVAYPQQCMWMTISVMKSSYNVRAKRCREIVDMATSKEPSLKAFFSDATNLANHLVELANKHVDNGISTLSISATIKTLPKLLEKVTFSKIMVPLQWAMNVTLPASIGPHPNHNPFARECVYIVGVDDTVEVMQSLQKPKKIALKCSDGHSYVFLCKPKDDLRKDFRLMEFNHLINRYLIRDPESRKRNLHIRTYAVVPLNEECGLIEWIPNLIGLRYVLSGIYKEKGILTSIPDLRRMIPTIKDSLAKKKEIFVNVLLPRHPPVFSQWLLSTFPDPQDWFLARLRYVRTLAVMSMVGFVVGLGDRHGENILFDSVCGDAVHVDFSCLFNKGETFEWPERVPFRLTHNMTEAMGPTGIEGSFRKCCEVTLRVLRTQSDTLLSVLKPFVHDPLVEWSKQTAKGRTDLGEIKNEQALEHVGNIERRLQGFLNCKSKTKIINLPLSVEGQVNQLICEATSIDNLAQMYVGWAAYC